MCVRYTGGHRDNLRYLSKRLLSIFDDVIANVVTHFCVELWQAASNLQILV